MILRRSYLYPRKRTILFSQQSFSSDPSGQSFSQSQTHLFGMHLESSWQRKSSTAQSRFIAVVVGAALEVAILKLPQRYSSDPSAQSV